MKKVVQNSMSARDAKLILNNLFQPMTIWFHTFQSREGKIEDSYHFILVSIIVIIRIYYHHRDQAICLTHLTSSNSMSHDRVGYMILFIQKKLSELLKVTQVGAKQEQLVFGLNYDRMNIKWTIIRSYITKNSDPQAAAACQESQTLVYNRQRRKPACCPSDLQKPGCHLQ